MISFYEIMDKLCPLVLIIKIIIRLKINLFLKVIQEKLFLLNKNKKKKIKRNFKKIACLNYFLDSKKWNLKIIV